ncbi:MAG: hypothetical protein IPI85_17335 [Dehalococcoidia bacterium]|nr:hypothetical protein [Dehalococcoidia bacterium]
MKPLAPCRARRSVAPQRLQRHISFRLRRRDHRSDVRRLGDKRATSAASAAATATKPAASATAAATAAATQATTKVSANNATRAQLQAAFEAAGIPNASQWAREVEEYRPYATTDTNMTKLRGELAKYNPAAGVVDKIVATLSLP